MATLSIPKELMKEGFVVLPRKEYREYEDFLRAKHSDNIVIKRDKSFKVPKRHEKFYDELDKELTIAVREIKQGKVVGPFTNTKDLFKSLGI